MLEKIQSFLRDRLSNAGEADGNQLSQAQLAATALLVEMSRSDFDVSPTEIEAIESAASRLLQIDVSEAHAVIEEAHRRADDSVSLYDFTALVQGEFEPAEKVQVVLELWRVAWADGSIAPHEDQLVRKVTGLLHVTHEDFIDAKLQARDERTAAQDQR